MLILTRKKNEAILIGDDIKITVVEIKGDQVRIGIDAPRSKAVHRQEVYDSIKEENRQAIMPSQEIRSLLQEFNQVRKEEENKE